MGQGREDAAFSVGWKRGYKGRTQNLLIQNSPDLVCMHGGRGTPFQEGLLWIPLAKNRTSVLCQDTKGYGQELRQAQTPRGVV